MRRTPLVLAALAAVLAVVLPPAAAVLTASGRLPPSLLPVVPLLAVLPAGAVVLVLGWAGHRAAARAAGAGMLTADLLTSAGTLAALAWSVSVAVPAAVSAAVPGAVSPPVPGPGASTVPTGGALLPGVAAVLTVVGTAARRVEGPAGSTAGNTAGLQVAADRWCSRLGPVALLVAVAVAGFRTGIGQPPAVAVPAGIAVLLAASPCALLAAVPAAVRAARRAGRETIRLPMPMPAGSGAAGFPLPVAGDNHTAPGGREGPGWWDPVGWTVPEDGPATVDRVDTVALAGPDVLTGGGGGAAPLTVHPAEGTDPEQVLRLAASVARGAADGSDLGPVARALDAALRDAGGSPPDVAEPDERPGHGVSGLVAELVPAAGTVVAHAVLLGSPAWLLEHGIGLPPEVSRARERAEAEGCAVVAVAWDGTARAVLAVRRSPHRTAATGIGALRAAGTEPALLTPDDDAAARALGSAADLDPSDPDAIRPGLDAAGRAAAVAGLQVRGRTVAVAADPRYDPGALAGADLAIALEPPDGSTAAPGPAVQGSVVQGSVVQGSVVHGRPAFEDGTGGFAVHGGPAEVATALTLARRARRAAAAGLRAALVAAGTGVAAAAAGLPAPAAAAVPLVATGAVLAVVQWRVRPPVQTRARPSRTVCRLELDGHGPRR
ncbi:hypothetical protein ACLFMI_02810 [Pseudonocardia nantongensis]|uniref:P-type ATPase n=1 Tax=Pseudonocardia nantongensis TaxID=1181885 RepID=UPI00397A79FC